jgi:hypothetical protein
MEFLFDFAVGIWDSPCVYTSNNQIQKDLIPNYTFEKLKGLLL